MARARATIALAPRTLVLALALWVLLQLMQKTLVTLALILIALILAAALAPAVRAMGERRVPRVLAVLAVFLAFLLGLGLVTALVIPIAVEQANALVANLPGYQRLGLEWIARLTALGSRYHVMPTTGTLVTQFEHFVTTDLATGLRSGIAYVVEALHLVADVLLIVLLSLFFLLSGPEITEGFVALFPARHRPVVREQIGPLGETLGRYVLGQVINMGALATLLAIGLSLVRLPYALLLAVLAGVFEIVPWLGGAVGLVGASLVALTVNWQTLLLTWLVFTIAHVIQGDLLAPYIQSKVVKIPPAVVLAALVLGGDLMGLLGAILAVPVTAMLFVIAQRLVVPYQDRQGGPAMPTGPPAPGS